VHAENERHLQYRECQAGYRRYGRCGAWVSECPVEAICAEEDGPEKWQSFTATSAEYFEIHADLFR
jgi:ferredoxin